MFELQKAAKLADAAITLPSTVMDAFNKGVKVGGLPMGVAWGAAALAQQLGQLRAIQSATFGGGSSGGGGGGGVSAPSVGSVGGGQERQQQPLTQRFVNINLSGSDNSMYSKGR